MNTFEPEEEPQIFVCDYEDCQPKYKAVANIPFVIPELGIAVIDRFFNKKTDYYLKGLLHAYKHPETRVIHGMRPHEIHVLGRSLQAIYN